MLLLSALTMAGVFFPSNASTSFVSWPHQGSPSWLSIVIGSFICLVRAKEGQLEQAEDDQNAAQEQRHNDEGQRSEKRQLVIPQRRTTLGEETRLSGVATSLMSDTGKRDDGQDDQRRLMTMVYGVADERAEDKGGWSTLLCSLSHILTS
ncbi:cyclic nucleotide-binding protein [Sesbania bispinosa]|nr:cyclic nucleotide-binding protein [Sesbania bispinosa]